MDAYDKAEQEIKKSLAQIDNLSERLLTMVKILKATFEKHHWVGIYLKEGENLILHNYIGLPTIHTKIPINEGICGAAVREKHTVIVADVMSDPRYIACSLGTRSEIVVPIYKGIEIIGEIDIDSDYPNAFNYRDQEFLERVAQEITKF